MADSTPENDAPCNGLVNPPPAEQAETKDSPPSGKRPSKRRHVPADQRRRLKAVETAQIATTPPSGGDMVFTVREFTTCTLPHSDPGPVLSWSRTNGHFTLGIVSGVDVKTGRPYGIPYGIIPRLLLVWIVTEILRTRCRRLELGHTLTEFLAKLGLSSYTGGGLRGDAQRVREQMERLFHSQIQFVESRKNKHGEGERGEAFLISDGWCLWWDKEDESPTGFWGMNYVEVSQKFFQSVLRSPNPLDLRVLRKVKDSALGIDLYTILNREAFLAMQEGKTRFLAWEWLQERTGNEYKEGKTGLDKFRLKALEQIKVLMEAHPGLVLKIIKGRAGQKSGIEISHLSEPSFLPREPKPAPIIIEGQARPLPSLSPVPTPPVPEPPPERHLKPATIEEFRRLYSGLAPAAVYDCKTAFDHWQAGLDPDKRAKRYDRAFMGFARRWIVGKIVIRNP